MIFEACLAIQHDLRSLKHKIVASYRFVDHEFLNLDMVQGSNRLVLHSSVTNS